MTDPVRTCLTFLRTGTLEQAGQLSYLPVSDQGLVGRAVSFVSELVGGGAPSSEDPSLSSRIDALATLVIGRDIALLEDADLSALRQIHAYPDLSSELKNRIFLACLRMGLVNIAPDARAEKAREIAHPVDRAAQPYILQGIELLAPANRTEASITALASLFRGLEDSQQLKILQTLRRLPASLRNALLASLQPSLIEGTTGKQRLSILRTLASFPETEYTDMVALTLRLVEGVTEAREEILLLIGNLPKERREFIVASAMLIMDGITDGKQRRYIFQVLCMLPRAQYDAIASLALPLIRTYIPEGYQRGYVLVTLGRLPEALRGTFVSQVEDMAKKNRLGPFLQLFQCLPRRLIFTAEMLLTLYSIVQNMPPALLKSILAKIKLLDPLARLDALNTLLIAHRAGTLTDSTIFSSLFATFPTLSETSSDYVLTMFATHTDPAYLCYLSGMVQRLYEELQLFEEHPLVQGAIKAYTNSEPSALLHPQNPYTLYEELEEQFFVPVELHPPAVTVEERTVSVCVQPLVTEAEAIRKALTFAQLPPAVNAQTVRELFERMDARLAALPPVERARVLAQIQAQSGSFYPALQQKMLYDPYLQRLLHTTGAPTNRVPLDVMQFFTVLQFILDKPDALQVGQLLTPREEALLKVAASIDACTGGKEEGVYGVYNWSQGQAATASPFNRQKVETYLYPIIYRLLSTLLSEDTLLMKQLAGSWIVGDVAHQAIYLKNLLGRALGLVWDLTFDLGTGKVSKPLAQKSIEEILDAFFEHFSPCALVDALQAQVNRDLSTTRSSDATESEKANTLYNLLFRALGENIGFWKTEEDEFGLPKSISLTKAGAAQLLLSSGYLQVST